MGTDTFDPRHHPRDTTGRFAPNVSRETPGVRLSATGRDFDSGPVHIVGSYTEITSLDEAHAHVRGMRARLLELGSKVGPARHDAEKVALDSVREAATSELSRSGNALDEDGAARHHGAGLVILALNQRAGIQS